MCGSCLEDRVSANTRLAAIPRQRPPLPRLSALLVSPRSERRREWSGHLHGVGIRRVLEATKPEDAVTRGRVDAERGVCVVESTPHDASVMQTVRELRRQGWDRLVLVTARGDNKIVRLALASHVRSLIVTARATRDVQRNPPAGETRPENLDLSDREVQVVQLVANGHTNRSVGAELKLSALTVKSHLSRIGRKLGTGDRAQIVATCMRARLIV